MTAVRPLSYRIVRIRKPTHRDLSLARDRVDLCPACAIDEY